MGEGKGFFNNLNRLAWKIIFKQTVFFHSLCFIKKFKK